MEEFYEMIKGLFSMTFILTLPLVFLFVPAAYVDGAYEFVGHRMYQLDYYGASQGCRRNSFNLEARSISTWKTSRHCVITKLVDLTVDNFTRVAHDSGAMIILLPKDVKKLTSVELENFAGIENFMLNEEFNIPIYFVKWEEGIEEIIRNVEMTSGVNTNSGTAFEAFMNSIFGMGYQVSVIAPPSYKIKDNKIMVIQGDVIGAQLVNTPTILIVAHYDSIGASPTLSFGADSNGSGIAVLIELLRIFSKIYSDKKTQGQYHLVFLLTGGGKLGFSGSKKWLEGNSDGNSPRGSYLRNVALTLCLDTLASSDTLYTHVSKVPKNGTYIYNFLQILNEVASEKVGIELVHKKINIANHMLAWEHERYAMNKLPAFTLSSLQSHKEWKRRTILDTVELMDVERIFKTTEILTETLTRFIFNNSHSYVETSHKANYESVKSLTEYISSQSRSSHIINQKSSPFILSLVSIANKYVPFSEIKYYDFDDHEQEFVFYDIFKVPVYIYRVKPAVFELVLSTAIGLYMVVLYVALKNFPTVYSLFVSMAPTQTKKIS